MLKFKIRILVEPDDVGYHAFCPELRGLHVGGDTEDEAFENARDAALAYVESLLKHNDPIPVGVLDEQKSRCASFVDFVRSLAKPRPHARIEELCVAL